MKILRHKNDMSNNKQIVTSGGTGVCGMTFVALMVLKLCGVINWSWWWVTAPLWIPCGLGIIILIIAGIIYLCAS